MQTLAASAALGPLVLACLTALSAPAAAAQTCLGQPATIVAEGGMIHYGTEGPDVIVSHGAAVRALGGDDLICLDGTFPVAEAGAGDDRVDARGADAPRVELGAGQDSFVGGPRTDQVSATPGDTERDVIDTGGGDDIVASGSPGAPNADDISTGPGADQVSLHGLLPSGHLDVGAGKNIVRFDLSSPLPASFSVNAAESAIRSGVQTSHWSGRIATYAFGTTGDSATSSLRFVGTRADERVVVESDRLAPRLRLDGGDDTAYLVDSAPRPVLRLGTGDDKLTLGSLDSVLDQFSLERVRVDLAAHTVHTGDGPDGRVHGVERLSATAAWVRLAGSGRAERITPHGCDVVARGRGGADVLRRNSSQVATPCAGDVRTRLLGGAGRDRVVGSPKSDDVLLGGRGFDVAVGRAGVDTCRAEVRRSCER